MFFYKSPDGLEHGPADLAEMKMRIENGSISVLTMVRIDGSRTWMFQTGMTFADLLKPLMSLPGAR